jgi:two-component system OmpR family sensor kinase
MALFETPDLPRARIVNPRELASARELFEELAEEWPEGVSLTAASPDGPLFIDPEWFGLAVRNLVENGVRHGGLPVAVTWSIDGPELVVRVVDAGTTRGFSLRRASRPFDRAEHSPGLGLGLAIVQRVAQLLRGRLSHEPSPTVFQLRVPKRSRS